MEGFSGMRVGAGDDRQAPDRRLHVLLLVALLITGSWWLDPGLPKEYSVPTYVWITDGKTGVGQLHRGRDAKRLLDVLTGGENSGQLLTPYPPVASCSWPARLAPFWGLPIPINRANTKTLTALPGIGPVLAARILAYRSTNGRIGSLEELAAVRGIGRALAARLEPHVCFE